MTHFLKSLLWFLVLALIAVVAHYFWGQKLCGTCTDRSWGSGDKPTQAAQFSDFAIKDINGKDLFKFPKGFVINSQNGEVEIPDELKGYKDSIYNYLNLNQGQELLISGNYLKAEGETRGLDRAQFLKNVLAKFGVNPDKIIPKAVLSEYSYDQQGKSSQGIGMVFRNISNEQLKVVEDNIADKTLFTKFGTSQFKPDLTLQAYALELINYLVKYPEKNIQITGHTDNVGSEESNLNLGLKRAQTVQKYLISQGIPQDKIQSESKGELEPVADNATEEGREQNRRITIKVK